MNIIPFLTDGPSKENSLWLQSLQDRLPGFRVVDGSTLGEDEKVGIEVAIVANPDPAELASFPDLIWVQSLWAGVEKLLTLPALADIHIVRLVDKNLAAAMAEAVLAWSLYLHRQMPAYREAQVQAHWNPLPYTPANERHIGILGCGELGLASLELLHRHGFNTHAWSRSTKDMTVAKHYYGEEGLAALLSTVDIVVCLLPLTNDTKHILNKQSLTLLKRDASVINFGRGALIDTDALLDQLDKDLIAHAVLDVFENEPLDPSSELWSHTKITVLPHISAPSSYETASMIAAKNLQAWFANRAIPKTVDRIQGY